MDPSSYLKEARRRAREYGYNPSKLIFADDGIHKLAIPNENGTLIRFGRVGYGDHILYQYLEKQGEVRRGLAESKRRTFHRSHSKIKGNWLKNDFSPNNLALRILW